MNVSKKMWAMRDIEELISLYHSKPELWDVKSKDYRNRALKQSILQEIADSLQTSPEEISRKVHNLRSQYNGELKKLKTKKSGESTDEYYDSKWPYFKALHFLQGISTERSTDGNFKLDIEAVYSIDSDNDIAGPKDDSVGEVTTYEVIETLGSVLKETGAYEIIPEVAETEGSVRKENVAGEVTSEVKETRGSVPKENGTAELTSEVKGTRGSKPKEKSGGELTSEVIGTRRSVPKETSAGELISETIRSRSLVPKKNGTCELPCEVIETRGSFNHSKRAKKSENNRDTLILTTAGTLAPEGDHYDIFGRYIASEMRNVRSDSLRRKMKRKFLKIILEINEEDEECTMDERSSSSVSTS